MRIKLDENLGLRTAGSFSEAGHDVATVYDHQLTSAPDAELFAICSRKGRILVTLDLDFADPFGSIRPRAQASRSSVCPSCQAGRT